MRVVISGSLGNINLPLVQQLLQDSNLDLTVISSSPSRKKDIESLGPNVHAAIGNLEDANFVTTALHQADSFYAMIPPGNIMDNSFDNLKYYITVGETFLSAILSNAETIKKVVFLSTIGAHMTSGNGILQGQTRVENILNNGLKNTEIEITILRPVAFYYNLLVFIPIIKETGLIMSNYGAEDVVYWVSPKDIASVVSQELVQNGHFKCKIRYIVSDKKSCKEVAKIIGKHIGIPELKWMLIPDEKVLKTFVDSGMNYSFAENLVEMQKTIHDQKMFEDLIQPGNMPVYGETKLEEYISDEFKSIFFEK